MTTSRREFFKTAAMGAVGAGAAFGTVAAEAKAAAPSKYDIIILGAGCGGLTCAVRAAENGLKPLLLEKMAMPAGNTIYAAGFLLGVNTSFQKAKNVQGDSAEQFLKDWMKVTQGKLMKSSLVLFAKTPMPPLNGFTVVAASTLRLVPSLSGRCFPAHISLLANTSRGAASWP